MPDAVVTLLSVLVLVLAVACAAFAVLYFGRNKDGQNTQAHLAEAMNLRIDTLSERVTNSLHEMSNRLTVIDGASNAMAALSGEVSGLKSVLSNRQARGAFGETQLRDIVTSAFPAEAHSFQETLSNGSRADCVIRFPGPPGAICVDSKFPLEAYVALAEAQSDHEREAAKRQFRTDITKHIQDIASKYIIPGETADSAVMFLPSEAVYAELHSSFRDIVTKSHEARVWIVSPTTMMAMLTTIRAVMTDAIMVQNAPQIRKLAGMIAADAQRLSQRVDKLASHHAQVETDLKQIGTSIESIVRRCGRLVDTDPGIETEE